MSSEKSPNLGLPKFECTKCGNCCKNLVGSEQDKLDLTPPCYIGSGPMVILNQPTLLLHPWEIDLFPIDNVIPLNVLFDIKNNQTIVLNYTLNVKSCPLLDDNGSCKIYNDRPLVCRIYPMPYQHLEPNQMTIEGGRSKLCPAEIPLEKLNPLLGMEKIDDNKYSFKVNKLLKNLYKRYGDAVVFGLVDQGLLKVSVPLLMSMQKQGKMKYAFDDYPIRYFVRRVATSQKVGVDKILRKYGLDIHEILGPEGLNKIRESLRS